MKLEDRLYSTTEVAKILGVSRRTLYRYLDAQNLESMQLPSGRHRFTKEQVEAFLRLNRGESLDDNSLQKRATPVQTATIEEPEAEAATDVPEEETTYTPPSVFSRVDTDEEDKDEEPASDIVEVEEEEEPEESIQPATQKLSAEEDDEVVQDLRKTLSNLFDEDEEEEMLVETKQSEENPFTYYKSSISDLKKLAKTIKIAAENSNIQYAFTSYAGASLYGEVKPFGVLHLYVRQSDMLFFEKRFDLEEADSPDEANMAISSVEELPEHTMVMGFKVVEQAKLKEDLAAVGEPEMAKNLSG